MPQAGRRLYVDQINIRTLIYRSSHEIGRGYQNRDRGLYLELERNGGGPPPDMSPPSDNVLFDNQCYATTPSSSNGEFLTLS